MTNTETIQLTATLAVGFIALLGIKRRKCCDEKSTKPLRWKIVSDSPTNFGYISWDDELKDGFKTRDEAIAARNKTKRWHETYQANLAAGLKTQPEPKSIKGFKIDECNFDA